jgi:hypothetical protein
MQTSFKALSIRLPFLANFRKRRQILAREGPDLAGLELPHSLAIPFGPHWTATVDVKMMTTLTCSIIFYFVAALLANEWLYLLSSALFIACFLGTWLPFLMLSSMAVDCWLPDKGVAADDANISVLLRHAKWLGWAKHFVPLRAVRARVILARRGVSGYQPHQDLGEQSLLLPDVGIQTLITLAVPHLSRGLYKMSHVSVCSSFPFGLVWWTRKIIPTRNEHSNTEAIVVYPRVWSMRGNFLQQIKGMLSQMGMDLSERLAWTQSTSVRGLRDFRVGDSLRHIHWKSSARQAKLLVREFDSETLPIFDLYLDLTARWVSREQFELAICLAHSLIQFGYDRDILPELFLRPSLDAAEIGDLMDDLPLAQAQLEMLSEILARVEPIPYNAAKPEIQTHRQLLALAPSSEQVIRGTASGDVCNPVLLVTLPTNTEGQVIDTNITNGTVIATAFSESDLEAL